MNRHDLPHTLSSEHKAIVNGCWRCDKMAKPIKDERANKDNKLLSTVNIQLGVERVCLVRCKAIVRRGSNTWNVEDVVVQESASLHRTHRERA